ncbi:hypothetical protein GTY87_03330 [Streptomyces sp. SID7813]|uniref:Uncharacterized protein n=7 Tax=Streptomyces TaxID=1883 RepID=Q9RJ86_STRCO|nr:conserved hypothetical protein [Streptomyces lividans TK24]MYU40204.1 hypothetical protein [Streptomyces sp. SID7813]QFI40933.1 hypothetical protein FQ762_03360 [Streptomyces coelicolor A3(2)]THA80867.1 hypothetical protein E6R61_36615 [Streptomyces sp. LRa12]CAB61196.1 hypothetical protein SCF91.39 [Streptomyces coelicolor A3(2)]
MSGGAVGTSTAGQNATSSTRRNVMAGVLDRIKQFARSPQGRRAAEQVRRAASDPRRRAQAQEMLRRFGKRR